MNSGVRVVLITVPVEEDGSSLAGDRIARTLVDEGLAACVSIFGPVQSVYKWKGEVCDDPEKLLVVKTTEQAWDKFEARVVELHPYDVPEILGLPVDQGLPAYLEWVQQEVNA